MKFLFILLLLWIIWRILRFAARKGRPPSPSPERGGERMLICAHCGVYAPEREMVRGAGERCYCSPEHRAAGEKSA
jgi:hypothetical protein